MSTQTDDVVVPDTVEDAFVPTSKELLKALDEWLSVSTDRTMFSQTEMQNFLLDTRAYIRSVDSGAFVPTPVVVPAPPVPKEDDGLGGFDPRSLLS